jgi:mono/diheme cytochrome c family protein
MAGSFVLLSLAVLALMGYPERTGSPKAAAAPTATTASQVEQGRALFTEKCGSCHNADAAKSLPDGSTLVARLAAKPALRAAVAGRIKKFAPAEQDAILAHLADVIRAYKAKSQ